MAQQGSTFCVYFADHSPVDWRDVAAHHDFDFDTRYRKALIDRGIYHFPLATKQGSISLAHTDFDLDETLARTVEVLAELSA